jgi:putative DNA primase/helicase
VVDATAEYRDEMDAVGAFIDDCCVRDPGAETPSKRLYDRYVQWCADHSDKAMGKADFGARLAEKGFTPGRTKTGRLWCGLVVTG